MKMDMNLKLTQEQRLIMTQEMQMSIKILQMSSVELLDYLEKEYQENPVLDTEVPDEVPPADPREEIDYRSLLKYLESDNYSGGEATQYDKEDVSPLNFISKEETLSEYLKNQISILNLDELTHALCEFIVDSLDQKGYFTDQLDEISTLLNVSCDEIVKAARIVKSLDPPGIGAKDLKECLILQLERKGMLTDAHRQVVMNHLDDVAEGRMTVIAKTLSLTPMEIQDILDDIKELEPKPSRGFSDGRGSSYIIPDGNIRVENGDIVIEMNTEFIPRLKISKACKDLINSSEHQDAQEYLKEMMNKAVFLLKSVEQRKDTVKTVIEKVVEKQHDYFATGDEFLKPMTMKDIAEELNVHESTISRAVREKYIYTPKGTIRLKDLFKTAAKGSNTDIVTDFVRDEIMTLIKNEDARSPLSDQALCDMLNAKGIDIKRRTVAKYREDLGIRSSSKRKRL
jgi:RNA polymerase sigma-54 factor